MLAYLDCFSGVSGNMLLGALLDAGYPEDSLRSILTTLPIAGTTVHIKKGSFQGFAATQVIVNEQEIDHHAHPHRHLSDIANLLHKSTLPESLSKRALAVFSRLAEAEAAVHGTNIEHIHFHEVGAADALIDIVGVLAGCAYLGIERLVCSPLPLNHGWVSCAHGDIPLPAPAVCQLLEGVPVYGVELPQELVTPTGVALARELACDFGPIPPMLVKQTSYGAGTIQRNDGRPNLLRLILGQSTEVREAQQVEVLETHLDDWNPEGWPYLSSQLMEAGALDVCLVPMQMKKGRPGYMLRVIGEMAYRPALTDLIFRETSAIGMRLHREQRLTLSRRMITISTPWGDLPAKEICTPDGSFVTPEYEACRKVAIMHQVPLQAVYAAVYRSDARRNG